MIIFELFSQKPFPKSCSGKTFLPSSRDSFIFAVPCLLPSSDVSDLC